MVEYHAPRRGLPDFSPDYGYLCWCTSRQCVDRYTSRPPANEVGVGSESVRKAKNRARDGFRVGRAVRFPQFYTLKGGGIN